MERSLHSKANERLPAAARVFAWALVAFQLGGSGALHSNASASTPGTIAHANSGRHPNRGSTYADSSAAIT